MNIWVIVVGEPLPTDDFSMRLLRIGMMSKLMSKRGHKVLWWTSSFDHFQKKDRELKAKELSCSENLSIRFIKAFGYKKNISFARFFDHWILKQRFKKEIYAKEKPDLILCSFPTIELTYEATLYANKVGIPIVVDVRDLWPDIFLDNVPGLFKKILKILLFYWFRMTKEIFENCTAVVAVSDGYLNWGLRYGNRKRTSLDRVFPLAYSNNSDQVYSKPKEGCTLTDSDLSKTIFIFIGSFGHTYDLSVVFNGIASLTEKERSDSVFICCGDGEFMDSWRGLAKEYNNVHFTGWLDAEKLGYYLSVASVGLCAYKKGAPQGIPNKIIEYMSVGLPVISSLQGEADKLIGEHNVGLTYNGTDPKEFSECVRTLLDAKTRDKMSENSKNLFLDRFSANNVYKEFAEYLESIQKLNTLKN